MEAQTRDTPPLFSLVVLNWNGGERVLNCLKSITQSQDITFEVILVDNASADGSFDEAHRAHMDDKRFVFVRNSQDLHYCWGMNAGIHRATGEYIVLLCEDTEMDPFCLSAVEEVFQWPAVGAVVPLIYSYTKRTLIDNAGQIVDRWGLSQGRGLGEIDRGQYDAIQEVFSGCGVGYAVRRQILQTLGGLDEDFVAYYEDVDLFWRIRLLGYKVVYTPRAILYHNHNHQRARNPRSQRHRLFHVRKNRVTMLLKNYSARSLGRYLLPAVGMELGIAVRSAMVHRRPDSILITLRALAWIVTHLRQILRKRWRIQMTRRVQESEIVAHLVGYPIALGGYQTTLTSRGAS